MTGFLTALGSGFSAKKILEFLMRKSPDMKQKITTALASGYSAEKVIKFLSKDKNYDKLKSQMEQSYPMEQNSNPLVQAQNVRSQNLGQDPASALQRNLPGIAAGAVGALAPALASGATQFALSRAIPHSLQDKLGLSPGSSNPLMQNSGVGNMQPMGSQQAMPPIQVPGQNVSSQPPISPSITQQAQPVQAQGIVNPKEFLEKLGVREVVDEMLKRGNKPEAVMAALQLKGGMGKAKTDPELLKNIEEYAKTAQPTTEMQPKPTESVGLAKGATVASPQGVGEIKEIRNGKAIVEIDGKKHQVNEDELESSPVPEKDLAELHDELLRGIEGETGEDVSRMVQWAGYNPENNTLQFLPHTGKLYKYKDISPEDATLLRDILSVRKTSGSNFIGAWKAGSKSPIGAALSKLIRKLQSERGGKGNEYEETHEPIYSAYEPAIEAKKKKKKKI